MLRGADLMAQCMASFHPTLKRGDAFLHNSPYHSNSHAADHTIIVPVVDDAGVHRFTVLAKAHLADCGNALPTTYMRAARDVYAEGAPIFPATKIQEDYQHVMDIVRLCQMRIRVPEQWWDDYLATLGAARVAEREILKLGVEYGWDRFHALERAWFDYSEARMIAAIRKLPAGTAVAENVHDPVPGTPADGVRIKAVVSVDPEAARITVDLRHNPDNMPCGLNLTEGTSTSGRSAASSIVSGPACRPMLAAIAGSTSASRAIQRAARSPPQISPIGGQRRAARIWDAWRRGRHGRRIWEQPATLLRRSFWLRPARRWRGFDQRGHPRCRRWPGHAGD